MRSGEAASKTPALLHAFAFRLFYFRLRFVPITSELHGQRFFARIAVDSVPAIFALTSEPRVVFTSNVLATLGLRALCFMLAGAIDKLHVLKYGPAVVLTFAGLKVVWLNGLFGGSSPSACHRASP